MDTKTSFLLLALALSATASAQTDVTASYVNNPSFEADNTATLTVVNNNADGLRGYKADAPSGWTVTNSSAMGASLIVTPACYTDNNFGKVTTVADGNQAFYMRMGWATNATTLKQTLANLPAGTYKLTANVRSAYANAAASSMRLFAEGKGTSLTFTKGEASCFATMPWEEMGVTFTTTAEGNVSIGLQVDWLSGGSCFMIDNFRLTRLPEGYVDPTEKVDSVKSITEGVITADFVDEATMKGDLLQMLGRFAKYLKNDFQDCAAPNSVGEACGCFKSNSTMQANEDGVRSNADLGMIAAFLVKYGKDKVTLSEGVTWTDLQDMARKSLVFAYSTHKANRLKVCAGNSYWGSTSTADHVWESSLWAMSVAYSAFFQWDELTDAQKGYVKALLKAECNYELGRTIPTGYAGDTKAEENGWEADVLAATLGLFPNDELAPKWFARLREFAINSYSHRNDANNHTVVDPDYDNATVADLYKGQNLYDDYTLQNHNYFHTSYQNVVIQELGEAALALKLFQNTLHGTEKWKTNALMHNNDAVQKEVLNWLALADGELAMPNGNDWSLFLYDQITSYTTNACFLRDADALMLENLAYKMIKARQQTTDDGSWLLRSDIGARRMGVEAHRVMMTWLMHEANTTADLTPSTFDNFRERYGAAKILPAQNIVRGYTRDRFTTFSWAPGITSYTGYIAANSVDKNKIIVPFKANNTGNFLGWYTVNGKKTNATPVVNGIYQLDGEAWTMNGELSTNEATLDNRFAIYSTPGNAVIYLDYVTGLANGTITREQGGLMAISTDTLTRTRRTLYTEEGVKQLDGTQLTTFETNWVNIDNALGIVAPNNKKMAFGDRANNNSVLTSKIYPAYDTQSRAFENGTVVDRRNIVYYSNVDATTTRSMNAGLVVLRDLLPEGWNGVIAADPDSVRYLLMSNFCSVQKATLKGVGTSLGAPVFPVATKIQGGEVAEATFVAEQNNSVACPIRFFVTGSDVTAKQDSTTKAIFIRNNKGTKQTVTVRVAHEGKVVEKAVAVKGDVKVSLVEGELVVENIPFPEAVGDTLTDGYADVTDRYLANANFEQDETYGARSKNVTASGVTYADCYTNVVSAISSKWPNVLPVKGWASATKLNAGSKFCRMYSMPFSQTLYCVSPSSVGNYAARTAQPVADDSCGVRCLTVLNSWDSGANAITQTITLPAGSYRLLLDMKYECANQTGNDGRTITTSGGNNNTSLTGVVVNGEKRYAYPKVANTWTVMPFDIDLDEPAEVVVSVGYKSDKSVGAANNTLLYVDHVRLLEKVTDGIANVVRVDVRPNADVIYNLMGQRINRPQHGIYIKGGKKFVSRP